MVIKVAAQIVQTTRRIVVRLAGNWPWWKMYRFLADRAVAFNSACPCAP